MSQPGTENRPNVVLIMADDLGYGGVSHYGATHVRTPNIDRIAQEGITFTDGNAPCSICTPSRYGLMTGQYAWRNPQVALRTGPEPLLLPEDHETLAQLFKKNGYATGCVGKWHLGFGEDPVDWHTSLTPGPLERGFDSFFGFPINLNNHPIVYIENQQYYNYDPSDPLSADYRSGAESSQIDFDTVSDILAEKAVTFIEQNKDNPFFLYFPTHQIHFPVHAAPRFDDTSDAGPYGDYIHDCDWTVGQILDTLDRLNLTENTLVFFTSDNGSYGNGQPIGKFRGADKAVGEDGEFGMRRNAPWKGYKWGHSQGGYRVPFVARWPGQIIPGTESDALVSLIDFYATFCELFAEQADSKAIDSVSFLSHLLPDKPTQARKNMIYHSGEDIFGIREQKWLLIFGGVQRWQIGWGIRGTVLHQLYNVATDPGETINVYDEHPDVVERLNEVLATETARTKRL